MGWQTYITDISLCFVLREERFETEITHNGDKKKELCLSWL